MEENFFYDFEFYSDLEELIYRLFDDADQEIKELSEDWEIECMQGKLSPIFQLSTDWILNRIDDDRFSENGIDKESDIITKVLDKHIDYNMINNSIPKLFFPDRTQKFKITKRDLLEWIR